MATHAGSAFDLDALRRGVEEADLDSMLGLYADDAQMSIVDQRHSPSHPQVLRGREQIGEMLADVAGRQMTHRLDHVTVGDGTVSYVERCIYPDGTRVLSTSVLDIAGGKITRHEELQAWDAAALPPQFTDFSRGEVASTDKRRVELVHLPDGDVGRVVLEPGWRFTEHAGPGLCQATHIGYQISGRLRIQMRDGATFDVLPGQVGTIPPDHDAWVVGDDPVVLIDWGAAGGTSRG